MKKVAEQAARHSGGKGRSAGRRWLGQAAELLRKKATDDEKGSLDGNMRLAHTATQNLSQTWFKRTRGGGTVCSPYRLRVFTEGRGPPSLFWTLASVSLSLSLFISLAPQVIAGVEELLDAEKQVHYYDEQDSDTEADEGALPLGSGVLGRGMPLMVGRGPTARALQDGAGLCSPGRWSPRQRTEVTQKDIVELRLLLRDAIDELLDKMGTTARELVERVTSADCQASPFPDCWTVALREAAHDTFGHDSRPRPEDRHCVVRLRLLRHILAAAGDPDAGAMLGYIEGVAIGVDTRMPRTPAAYARKRRWNLEASGSASRAIWRRSSPWNGAPTTARPTCRRTNLNGNWIS